MTADYGKVCKLWMRWRIDFCRGYRWYILFLIYKEIVNEQKSAGFFQQDNMYCPRQVFRIILWHYHPSRAPYPRCCLWFTCFSVVRYCLWFTYELWLYLYCLWFTYGSDDCVDIVCDLHMIQVTVDIVCDLHMTLVTASIMSVIYIWLVTVSILCVIYIWLWWLCRYCLWLTYGSDDCVDIVGALPMTLVTVSILSVIYIWLMTVDIVCDLPMTLVTVSIFSVIYIWLWWLCRYCRGFTYDS